MRRWFLLFAVLLHCCMGLPAGADAAEQPSRAGNSWDTIDAIEHQAAQTASFQSGEALAAAYAQQLEQMIEAVESAPDYVPGSLERHGSFFFWQTADGRANGYSPTLRAELRRQSGGTQAAFPAAPGQDEAAGQTSPTGQTESDALPEAQDVGVFIPYAGSYYFEAEKCIAVGQRMARSTSGTLHVYTAENCTVDTLAEAIGQCGLLLINSHGQTDYEAGYDHSTRANSSYICLPTAAGVTAEDQMPVQGRYGTYYHAFYAGPSEDFDEEYYCVDGTCIAAHMAGDAPNSMIWMGFCLGMTTEGFFAPLRGRGVEAMIGFSEAVTTNADHEYRDVFCEALLADCTVGEAAAVMKAEVGEFDPYQTLHTPAYPIAVSSRDAYPGRTHLTDGQEVHSVWKLYPAYPIEVTAEPADSAEIAVCRNRVTVTPARGFDFSGWEVTAGEAEAEYSGGTLEFALTGPCAVTIRMEARTPAAVHFSAGPGQSAAEIDEFVGDTVLLPAPEGTLTADAYLYHFLGWTAELMAQDGETCPNLLKPGTKMKLTQPELELRAVYGYFVPEDGTSAGQFRLVDGEPDNWAGEYVITYQSARALRASGLVTGQSIASASGTVTHTEAGYFIDGEWLNEVPEDVVWSFLPDETGGGLLKMKKSDNYLIVPSSSVMLSTTADASSAGTLWRMKWIDGAVRISNVRFSSRILQYSTASSGFCTLTTPKKQLTVYARVPGTHLYTLEPSSGEIEPVPGPEPVPIQGDVDGDGTVTARDAALLQKYVAHWPVAIDETAADLNGDGRINARDIALLVRYLAGWDIKKQTAQAVCFLHRVTSGRSWD